MKRLLVMLAVLGVFACLLACAASREATQPSTTTNPTTSPTTVNSGDGGSVSSSAIPIPEAPETSVPPVLPTGTLPQITLPLEPPPDFTIPVEPTPGTPDQELS